MHMIFALRHLTSDIVLFYPKHLLIVYNIHDSDCEVHIFCGYQSLWSDLPIEVTAIKWISVTWRQTYST